MTSNLRWLVCTLSIGLAFGIGWLCQSASALDTPNILMTIDGMTMNHNGLFRNATPNDGYNTFQFGPILFAPGTLGRYKSFYFVKNNTGDGGISHNARFNSNSPETWNGTANAPVTGVDLDSDYFPIIDRSNWGQVFDPAEYQIEVKYKTNIGVAGLPNNTAPLFTVGLDQNDGFNWDAEAGVYKRSNDAFSYNIGAQGDFNNDGTVDAADFARWRLNDIPNLALPNDAGLTTQAGRYGLWRANFGKQNLNTYFTNAPKDADGYATYTVPVNQPSFVQRGFYYSFGDGAFRTNNVVTGNGRVQNPDLTWSDSNDGLDTLSFGGGATDPSRPGSQLRVPNGVPLMSFGAPSTESGLSVQIKYITLKRITPNPIVARIDANSGFTFKFGSGLGRSNTDTPIMVDGIPFLPPATDQISRFDQSGMTNLIINMRTPDATDTGAQRFFIRGGPSAQTFDGTTATVNVRAKLLPTNTATSIQINAKDLDGNDNTGAGSGGDEYQYNLDLTPYMGTGTFFNVSIPLSSFTLAPFVATVTGTPGVVGSGPFGFTNPGDGLRTNFDLYEFGVLIGAGQLLRMEMEYMEIRLPGSGSSLAFGAVPEPAAGMLSCIAAVLMAFGRRRRK